jgi:hypothetical protein
LSALAIARNDVAAARLYLLDDRQHIGRKAVCICLVGGCHFAFTGGEENMNPGISCGVAGVACELLLRITNPTILPSILLVGSWLPSGERHPQETPVHIRFSPQMRYEQFSVALPQAAAVMRALPLLVLSIGLRAYAGPF